MNEQLNEQSVEILLYVGSFCLGAIVTAIIILVRFKNNIKKIKP